VGGWKLNDGADGTEVCSAPKRTLSPDYVPSERIDETEPRSGCTVRRQGSEQDYRHGDRVVFHNGKIIKTTKQKGMISESEIERLAEKAEQ
jgi:hypothetical protein